MREANAGKILITGSIAGFMPDGKRPPLIYHRNLF
jgi:hypothetical protein